MPGLRPRLGSHGLPRIRRPVVDLCCGGADGAREAGRRRRQGRRPSSSCKFHTVQLEQSRLREGGGWLAGRGTHCVEAKQAHISGRLRSEGSDRRDGQRHGGGWLGFAEQDDPWRVLLSGCARLGRGRHGDVAQLPLHLHAGAQGALPQLRRKRELAGRRRRGTARGVAHRSRAQCHARAQLLPRRLRDRTESLRVASVPAVMLFRLVVGPHLPCRARQQISVEGCSGSVC
mmetsp:Transcript_36194/g.104097  ORF Transcript_36194/g.104097 Transcript_36194/m.104097 type:complete len:231 (-) Transcript_36194:55-747(-)